MMKTQADKETMAHNLLSSGSYTRGSEVYKRAHKALSRLPFRVFRVLDALWAIECTKCINRKEGNS